LLVAGIAIQDEFQSTKTPLEQSEGVGKELLHLRWTRHS
jgi:hypothetical protein